MANSEHWRTVRERAPTMQHAAALDGIGSILQKARGLGMNLVDTALIIEYQCIAEPDVPLDAITLSALQILKDYDAPLNIYFKGPWSQIEDKGVSGLFKYAITRGETRVAKDDDSGYRMTSINGSLETVIASQIQFYAARRAKAHIFRVRSDFKSDPYFEVASTEEGKNLLVLLCHMYRHSLGRW